MTEPVIFGIIAVTSLLLGGLAGMVMYRADFCVASMFRDLFLLRDTFMLRQLVVLIVISMLLFELGRSIGWIRAYPFPLLGTPSLASLIGGVLFGVGMVLAGGCVVGTLYRMGSGSALSLTAFIGLLAGSTVYAEFHPAWATFADATRLSEAVTLPQLLGMLPVSLLILATILAVVVYRWYRHGLLLRAGYATGYLQPLHAAIILSVLGVVSYLMIGMPMGITTSYTKLGSAIETLIIPEHVARLIYLKATPLNYSPPFAYQTITGGAGPAFDGIAAIQYPLIAGIILGALLYSIKVREFQWHYQVPVRHYASAILGGVLLGLGSRMVPGCNVWHLWGGLPILANQSLLFAIGLFPGAWLGSRLLARLVIKS